MIKTPFITCDLLDNNPESSVIPASIDGKMFKNFGGRSVFAGDVFTVKCFEDNSVVKAQLATPGKGRVLVVDGGASMRCALIGDLIAATAVKSGWAGVVVFGCVRDVDQLKTLDIGIQALGATPQKSLRMGRGDLEIPINIGGVIIETGDYLYADNNGVIISKQRLIEL